MSRKPKKDYVMAGLGLAFLALSPVAVLLAIWLDVRWGWTALLLVVLGAVCVTLSIELDKLYAKRALTETGEAE